MMGEVEGGTESSCLQFLRHETGHAIDNAYNLQHRKQWQELFGKASRPYPHKWKYTPDSREFVRNLDFWYAQRHPVEDFAETFAVWLDPHSRWKKRYEGWKAFKKLEYVDQIAGNVAQLVPRLRVTKMGSPSISVMKTTLRSHYRRKQAHYRRYYSSFPGYEA